MAVISTAAQGESYDAFVRRYERLLRRYVADKLKVGSRDADDALQEGLIRIWREYGRWQSDGLDDSQRLRYAQQQLRQASIDVLRLRDGRTERSRSEHQLHFIDFQELELEFESTAQQADTVGEVRKRLQDLISAQDGELDAIHGADGDIDAELVERCKVAAAAAVAALSPLQAQVYFAHRASRGQRRLDQLAAQFGVSHQKARTALMEARAIVSPLVAHALAPDLDPEERSRVLAYSSREMTDWRERARMKAHLAHCAKCRELLEAERVVVAAGAHLLAPLPAIVGLAKAAGAAAAVAGAGAAAAGTLSSGTAGGGLFSGLAAKLAAGAAMIAAAAGGVVAIDGPAGARAKDAAAGERAPAIAAVATAAPPARVAPSPTAAPAEAKRDRRPRKAKRKPKASAVQREFATPTAAPARSTPAASPAPAATLSAPAPKPAREPASSEFGGEFAP